MTISPASVRYGARNPSLRSVPAYRSSAGPEAIALAADAGLILDPWQADTLTHALGERDDGRWAAFRVGVIVSRQNGKGSLLEARVLAGLHLFGEKLIMWTAHEMKTALEAFRRVEALLEASPDLRRRVARNGVARGNGKEGFEFRNGARLRFVARSKGSGRGFTGDCVILDEAYALTEEQLSALMPTMSARPNPQIWFTSSPPLDGESGEALFRLRDKAIEGDPRLAYFDWGLQGHDLGDLHGVDLDDRNLWAATNPAFGHRLSEEFTAEERSSMSEVDFARERLGIWPPPDSGTAVLDVRKFNALVDEGSSAVDPVAFAIDVTPDRQYACVAMYGRRADGLGHCEIVDHRPGTEWVVPRVLGLMDRWKPVAIAFDMRSPAGSLLVDFEKAGLKLPGDEPQWGDLALPTPQHVAGSAGQFADAVNQGTLRHLGDVRLSTAVAGAKTRPLGDAWAWARRVATVDISGLCAVSLARWAYESRAHLIVDYDPLANIW